METMLEEIIAHQEQIIAKTDACLEITEANPGSVRLVR
jgi:hypothetical protein